MAHEPEQIWLTLEDVAAALKVGVPTVQSLINRGLLSAEQRPGGPAVSQAALLDFLRADQRTLMEDGQQSPDLGLFPEERPAARPKEDH
jgi:hypothetical protein